MNVDELMLYDFVYNITEGKNERITGINNDGEIISFTNYIYDIDDFKPIPIAAEILEKMGFDHKYKGEPLKRQYWIKWIDGANIHVKPYGGKFDFHITGIPMRPEWKKPIFSSVFDYVHQLQQAMRLCGIKKEIEL